MASIIVDIGRRFPSPTNKGTFCSDETILDRFIVPLAKIENEGGEEEALSFSLCADQRLFVLSMQETQGPTNSSLL
jgi:hypothetical protein